MSNTPSRTVARVALIVAVSLLAHAASAATSTDLILAKTNAGPFMVGANGIYQLTVYNVGGGTTDDPITVVDSLPTSLSFVSSSGGGWTCTASGHTVTCTNPGPLAPGANSKLFLTVSVGAAAYPTVTNMATVSYAGDIDTTNNTARRPTTVRQGVPVTPVTPSTTPTSLHIPTPTATATQTSTPSPTVGNVTATDLSLVKTTGGAFSVGSNAVYVLTVTNEGAGTTNAATTVTDSLPTGLSFVSASGTGWDCSASGQIVTCITGAALPPGGGATISLTVSVGSSAYPSVTNSATVSYPGDTNAANDVARKPTTVRAARRAAPPAHAPHAPHATHPIH